MSFDSVSPASSADSPSGAASANRNTPGIWDVALFEATSKGDIAAMRHAIAQGANVNQSFSEGYNSCLMRAINISGGDRAATMRVLLDNGADPNQGNRKAYTPLHFTANSNDVECLQTLLDYGANPNAMSKMGIGNTVGESPLHEAVRKNRRDVIAPLLQAGADPLLPSGRGLTPMDEVPEWSDTLRALLEDYANLPRLDVGEGVSRLQKTRLFAADALDRTPLHNPLTWRNYPQISQLLATQGERLGKADLWANDNATGSLSRSCLRAACEARMLTPLIEEWNRHGESLSVPELLSCDVPLASIECKANLQAIFSRENMMLQGKDGLSASLSALSDAALVPHRHALGEAIRRESAAQITHRGR